MKTRLIIFDWDDVITLGSKEGYFACYKKALADKLGKEITWEDAKKDILATWGSTARDTISAVLKKYPETIEESLASYLDYVLGKTFLDHLSVVSGLQDTLQMLSEKYTLCVTTGMHPDTLYKYVIPKFNIPEVFSDILTGYDIDEPKLRKPNPYTANLFMEKHNIKPEETVLVGDAENDVEMAYAAKVTPVVVLTGHLTKEEAEELGVEHIIPDVTHLPDLLANK